MYSIEVSLPENIKSGGVDNGVVYSLIEEISFLSNTEVYPNPTEEVIVTITFKNGKKANLRGFITESNLVKVSCGGVDYVYTFVAQQFKLPDAEDDEELPGFYEGKLQFSKFRWALVELTPSNESAFESASVSIEAKKEQFSTKFVVRDVIQKAFELGEAGKYEDAIAELTRALFIDLAIEEENDKEDDPELEALQNHNKDRIEIIATRSKYAYLMEAFRASKRDVDLLIKICGKPNEAILELTDAEGPHYFEAVVRRAECLEKIGEDLQALESYGELLILKALKEGDVVTEEGEKSELVPPISHELSENFIARVTDALKRFEATSNDMTVFSLKIQLRGVEPPVWRTLDVTANTFLDEFREYIMNTMGWFGSADGEFNVEDHGIVRFTEIPEEEEELEQDISENFDEFEDESYVTLGEIIAAKGDSFTFLYEDKKWIHDITIEAVRQETIKEEEEDKKADNDEDVDPEYPKCTGGAYACPPEGLGPEGYAEFLKSALNDEKTERFEGRLKALEYAAEHIGFTNDALSSWGGVQSKVTSNLVDGKQVIEVINENAKSGDVNVGGWDIEAFSIDNVNDSLASLVGLSDGWEDEEDEVDVKEE
ncbi:hypothetical protein HK098_000813 [Nowakowskiella sp. JEL0407]|nr:hypothetical protein HK098_000813 [Nowakowskiella sp. JEL0407]